MSKFRTSAYDAPEPREPNAIRPGTLPDNRIPIFDHRGNMRGHVGKLATAATVSRFGVSGAKLGKRDGRTAWLGSKPSVAPKKDAKLAASLRAAKGSNK
jgi:hypothetical protein